MAAQNDESTGADLSEFAAPDDSNDGSDDQSISLDPGESFVGRITDVSLDAGDDGDAGAIEVDGKTVWLNWTLRRQLVTALLEGKEIAYVKLDEEESFEDGDGETVTYNPREFRFREDS